MVKVKTLPQPGTLSTPISPPSAQTSSREMASPSPVPPCTRVVEVSACVKTSKSPAIASDSIPMPVSATLTVIRTRSPVRSADARTTTSPSSVNFTALAVRLSSTWANRTGSPQTMSGTVASQAATRSRPFSRADSPSMLSTWSKTGRTAKSTRSSCSLPASILEKSRMPLIRPSSDRLATCTPEASCSWRGSRRVRSSRSVRPITPLSGVRISWLIVARNSDFWRDASIAASRASARARSACSRSTTRASCTATWPTIESIIAWRKSGGAEVSVMTA